MKKLAAIALMIAISLLLTSCVAQQADVVRIKKALDARISKLDESKVALEQAVAAANQSLGEAKAIIATQRAEIHELLSARAEVMDQVATIKDGDLSEVRGAIDQSEHHLLSVTQQMAQLGEVVKRTREEAAIREKKIQPVIEQVQQQLMQQNEVVTSQAKKLSEFQASFVSFREALDTVRDALGAQEAKWVAVNTQLMNVSNVQVGNNEVAQGNWEEMKRSVASVVSAFEQVSQTLADRLDKHERQLSQVVQKGGVSRSASDISRSVGQTTIQKAPLHELQESMRQLAPSQGTVPVTNTSVSIPRQGALLKHQMARGSLEKLDRSKIIEQTNVSPSKPRSPTQTKPSDQELAFYRQNYEMLQTGDFRGAFQGFRQFLQQHPRSALASNAQYWLGECYYGQRQYSQAIREFEQVLTYHPNSRKVPAALLKIGYSHLGLQDPKAARLMFRQLLRSYPKSRAAAKAYTRLTEVDQSRKEAS